MIRASRTGAGLAVGAVAFFHALPLMAEEAEGGGLPQLDPAFFPGQLFWLAVTFGLLYVLMAYVALPGVRRALDKRQAVIEADLAAAAAANGDAKNILSSYEKALADARAKAHVLLNDVKEQASKELAQQQAAQHQQLSQKLHEAETKIAAARTAAMREVDATASGLAQVIMDKLVGAKAGPAASGR